MRTSKSLPVLVQLLIVAIFFVILTLIGKYLPWSFSLVSPHVNAIITATLVGVLIILLIRRHLHSRALPPDAVTAKQLAQPHLIAVLLTGVSLLLTISVANVIGATVCAFCLLGLAGNVCRHPGRRPDNDRMLAFTIGSLLFLVVVLMPTILGT